MEAVLSSHIYVGFGYRTQMALIADSPFAGPGDTISIEFIPELLVLLTNVREPE